MKFINDSEGIFWMDCYKAYCNSGKFIYQQDGTNNAARFADDGLEELRERYGTHLRPDETNS